MTTYVTMRNRILDEFVNESLTTAQVNNAILSAIAQYERQEFYFNQKTNTFSTVSSQEYYSSSDLSDIPNIITIRSMTATVSGYKEPVTAQDFTVIDDLQDGTITDSPEHYTLFKQQIRLYPIPDGVYTITMAYVYRLTALSADGDSNAWTTDAEELIRQAAKLRLALDILHADDIAARCGLLLQSALNELRAETRRRLPQSLLRVPVDLQPIGRFNFTTGE